MTLVLVIGIIASVFVGFNIGGSSTGIAWGPAVEAGLVRKTTAAGAMIFFVFLGGWTIGRNVIDTLSNGIITSSISIESGSALLLCIGLGILLANVIGVPVATSMTTVGSIAGLGLATGTIRWAVVGEIAVWWLVTPVIGFWAGAVIGRYLYPSLDRRVRMTTSRGALLRIDRDGILPTLALGPNTTAQELLGTVLVLVSACYMAFVAGASNVPNVVAPVVSDGVVGGDAAIGIGTIAIGLGGFTIARRTMESVGSDLTEMSLLSAVLVMLTAATITGILSFIGIPISLVMATVMTIVGLGWGRASRLVVEYGELREDQANATEPVKTGVVAEKATENHPPIIARNAQAATSATELFDPGSVAKFTSVWILGPCVSAGLSYAFFAVLPVGG